LGKEQGLEKRRKVGWYQGMVFWGDENGDLNAARDKGLGEVQEGDQVSGSREGVCQHVTSCSRHVWTLACVSVSDDDDEWLK